MAKRLPTTTDIDDIKIIGRGAPKDGKLTRLKQKNKELENRNEQLESELQKLRDKIDKLEPALRYDRGDEIWLRVIVAEDTEMSARWVDVVRVGDEKAIDEDYGPEEIVRVPVEETQAINSDVLDDYEAISDDTHSYLERIQHGDQDDLNMPVLIRFMATKIHNNKLVVTTPDVANGRNLYVPMRAIVARDRGRLKELRKVTSE